MQRPRPAARLRPGADERKQEMVKLTDIAWQRDVIQDDLEDIVGPIPPHKRRKRRLKRGKPAAEHVAEDAAFLMANPDLRDALETLVHRGGGNGEIAEFRWQRMLGLTENELGVVIDELSHRRIVDLCDHEEHDGPWFWVLTDRGRAAYEAVAPAVAREARWQRYLGPLTLADLWAHDCLVDKGPLPWMAWAAEARPHPYRAVQEAWRKSDKSIGEDGNYRWPPYDTAFAKSAFKLLKRGYVERREDGTYGTTRGMILKPEADMDV